MREVAAVTVCDRREKVFPVARSLERDLGYPRELFANGVSVLGVGRAEFVKINLLIKIQISVRPLAFSGKTRVIDSGAIAVPSRAAPRSRILNVCDGVWQRFVR